MISWQEPHGNEVLYPIKRITYNNQSHSETIIFRFNSQGLNLCVFKASLGNKLELFACSVLSQKQSGMKQRQKYTKMKRTKQGKDVEFEELLT